MGDDFIGLQCASLDPYDEEPHRLASVFIGDAATGALGDAGLVCPYGWYSHL